MNFKKRLAVLLATVIIFVNVFSVTNVSAMEINVKENVASLYSQALSLAGGRGSFHGSCNLATAYQLLAAGIYKGGLDYSGGGNKWYNHYKNESKTSGGYKVITIGGENCLRKLIDTYGNEIYNVVYSLGTGGTSGNTHVLFIRAIIDGTVYFADSFTSYYNGRYYPEGSCCTTTVDNFIASYERMNGKAFGCVYFTNGETIIRTDTTTPEVLKPGKYMTTASLLHLRAEPSTSSQSQCLIPYGTMVNVTEIKNNWGKTSYDNHKGWICLDYAVEVTASSSQEGSDYKITADKEFAFSGTKITWTVSPTGKDLNYSFTVTEDEKVVLSTSASSNNKFTYTVKNDAIYQVIATVFEGDKEVAIISSDEFICPGDRELAVIGDANCDGKVNALDARITLRHAIKLEKISGKGMALADINNDGKITAVDASLIIKKAVGIKA